MWLAAAAVSGGGAGCASYGAPPGGPERHEPPQVVAIMPDSGAKNVRTRSVEFRFDEVISDRPTLGELDQYFLISPRDGNVRVSWHRSAISVRPRKNFRSNTAYAVTLLPGLGDLRGNVMKNGETIVFSTGPEIPRYGIVGRAFDWIGEKPAAHAMVEAISHPDSVVYVAAADSLGAFSIGPFGPGIYTLRAYVDANNNRTLDRGEIWDSVQVSAVTSRPYEELLLIARDTIGPALQTVGVQDSVTLQLTFDRPVDPQQTLSPDLFRVVRSDSAALAVIRVLTKAEASQEQTIRATALADSVERARRDSIRRVRPDSADRGDTTRRPSPPPAPPPPPVSAVPLPTRAPAVSGRSADSVGTPGSALKPKLPAPSPTVVLRLGNRLESGRTYRVIAIGIRNVMHRAATTNRTVAIPKPAPRAPGDSTRRPSVRPPGQTPAPAPGPPG